MVLLYKFLLKSILSITFLKNLLIQICIAEGEVKDEENINNFCDASDDSKLYVN